MFLIDTDILSALRRRQRNPHVVRWMLDQRMTDLYLSVVSLGEIERGITRQRHRDPTFAHVLAAWLDNVLALCHTRILDVDLPTARRWGRLSATLGGTSKNASWMVKDDRIGHSHRFGGKINSAFRGISPLGNGDSTVKEDIWYAPSHTAYAQPTIPRRCNPTRRRML